MYLMHGSDVIYDVFERDYDAQRTFWEELFRFSGSAFWLVFVLWAITSVIGELSKTHVYGKIENKVYSRIRGVLGNLGLFKVEDKPILMGMIYKICNDHRKGYRIDEDLYSVKQLVAYLEKRSLLRVQELREQEHLVEARSIASSVFSR